MAKDIENIQQRDRIPAVLLGLGTIGLAVARSLGMMGVPVTGIDKSRLSAGLYSRYCTGILCPDPETDEAGYIDFLMDLATGFVDRPVLIPTRDQEVAVAARHKDELTKSYRLPWSDDEVIGKLVDKKKFYELIKDTGIDYPVTCVPQDAVQATAMSHQVPYPCIVKPVDTVPFSRQFSVKCFFASNADELLRGYSRAVSNGHEVIFQEVIPGDEQCLYMAGGYFNRDSEPLGMFLQRKIRSSPEQYGIGSLVESWEDPEVLRLGTEFLRQIRFHGIGVVEFKKDARDGSYKVLEVNARPWTQTWLATSSGVNLPFIAYLDAIGKPVEPLIDYRAGLKWLSMSEDFRTCLSRAKNGSIGLREYLRSLRGEKVYSVLDFADLAPFLMSPIQLGNMSVNYLRKKARHKAVHPDANPGIIPLRH
jgi:D-aspartate ligase